MVLKTGARQTINTVPIISLPDIAKPEYKEHMILVSVPSAQKEELNEAFAALGFSPDKVHYLFDTAIKFMADNPLTQQELEQVHMSINAHKWTY